MAARLRAVESRNVTHVSDVWPVFWREARGANVRDVDGNVYVDLTGAFGVALLGHRPDVVADAVARQSDVLVHGMGDVHPPTAKLELLERLARIAPWPDARVVLATSGSEAVEAALKTARLASGRPGILAFEGGYHGLTLGSLATTPREHFRAPFSERLYPGVSFAPFPDPSRGGEGAGGAALARAAELLRAGAPNGDRIGTVIVEPVQARGGARIPPEGFMTRLSELATEHGALVIADEVMTGLGRCGEMLASDLVGLRPDIVCVGKSLGGGLPISACIAPRPVMDAWPESEGEAVHTSTFLGHPLACAAASAVLEELDRAEVAPAASVLGTELLDGLRASLGGVDVVLEVRGLGLLLGIDLVESGGRTPAAGAAARVAEKALSRGLLVLPAGERGNVVELTPPVTLGRAQAEYAVEALAEVVTNGEWRR
jgi:4-aminobutyrate aminotransferase-like enzyme